MTSIVVSNAGAGNSPATTSGTDISKKTDSTLDDAVVSGNKSAKDAGKEIMKLGGELSMETKTVKGDRGLYALCMGLLNRGTTSDRTEKRYRPGKEIDDPATLKVDPFVAKRHPENGNVMMILAKDIEKFKKRYDQIALVSPDRKTIIAGKAEGNTVVFPGSNRVSEDWLIVRQPKSIIGSWCGGDMLAKVESLVFRTGAVESLLRRSKCCKVGAALQAGLEQESKEAAA